MKLYIVVDEWTPEGTDYDMREQVCYTLDKVFAKAELDAVARRYGVDLPHDQMWFSPQDDGSLRIRNTFYIEEVELHG